ncbi:MAG: DNA-directed RNA polymerase subunit delta [Bacilli bacterium]|nr:DNA-directed RNA polymerase subunit delta [Bacilli bacterium]
MDIQKITKEELEQLSYADITYYILQQKNKPQKTATLFKQIIKLLGLPESAFAEKIGDFYTSLTTDKRFIALDNETWDLRLKHSTKKFKTEPEEEEEEEINIDEENNEDDSYDDSGDEIDDLDDDSEDVLDGLTLVEEDYEIE